MKALFVNHDVECCLFCLFFLFLTNYIFFQGQLLLHILLFFLYVLMSKINNDDNDDDEDENEEEKEEEEEAEDDSLTQFIVSIKPSPFLPSISK